MVAFVFGRDAVAPYWISTTDANKVFFFLRVILCRLFENSDVKEVVNDTVTPYAPISLIPRLIDFSRVKKIDGPLTL